MSSQYTLKAPTSVYLIRLGDTDYYKVGISQDVRARLASLQTATPFGLVLLDRVEQQDALLIERDIHKALHEYQVRNEWFRCEHETIVRIFSAYNAMGIADKALADPGLDASVYLRLLRMEDASDTEKIMTLARNEFDTASILSALGGNRQNTLALIRQVLVENS